jgi:hypothetical protein
MFGRIREWLNFRHRLNVERDRRIYYQDIVYAVCNQLDRAFGKRVTRGEGTVCGSIEEPSQEVQVLMKELVDRDQRRNELLTKHDPGVVARMEG